MILIMQILTKSKVSFDNIKTDLILLDIETLADKSEKINKNLAKRFVDLIVSFLFLFLIFSWLFPIIACFIKLTSKGPVFFVQKRIGYRGIIFNCYKFRTMYINKSGNSKFMPVSIGDSRITKVGIILRKLNLDELPQILNVIKGEMSIVGPRPHAIPFHEKYSTFIEFIDSRHYVKPGITGLAQVFGFRGDVEDENKNKERTRRRIQLDIKYIEEWTLWIDFKLIFLTFWNMIKNESKGH